MRVGDFICHDNEAAERWRTWRRIVLIDKSGPEWLYHYQFSNGSYSNCRAGSIKEFVPGSQGITIQRYDGYVWTFVRLPKKRGITIQAGCRHFRSFAAARRHYRNPFYHRSKKGREMTVILNTLEKLAIERGLLRRRK